MTSMDADECMRSNSAKHVQHSPHTLGRSPEAGLPHLHICNRPLPPPNAFQYTIGEGLWAVAIGSQIWSRRRGEGILRRGSSALVELTAVLWKSWSLLCHRIMLCFASHWVPSLVVCGASHTTRNAFGVATSWSCVGAVCSHYRHAGKAAAGSCSDGFQKFI